MLDFPLPVGRTVFQVFPLTCWTPKTYSSSRWNFASISSTSRDKSSTGLEAAILDFELPVSYYNILFSPIGLPDLENVGLAVEISFVSHLEAETKVFPVWRPPSWILHCRFPFPVSLYYIPTSPVGELNPQNID